MSQGELLGGAWLCISSLGTTLFAEGRRESAKACFRAIWRAGGLGRLKLGLGPEAGTDAAFFVDLLRVGSRPVFLLTAWVK